MSRTRRIHLDQLGEDPQQVTFVNPGEWFKKRWLIGVGIGFSCLFYIVEADCESDAIDELTDSDWGHIVKSECGHEDREDCSFAGNYGEHVDLDEIRILERL